MSTEQSTTASAGELRFEQAVSELEQIVQRLNQPNIDLEEALALYERGVHLAQRGRQLITHAEARVTTLRESLTRADGDPNASRA